MKILVSVLALALAVGFVAACEPPAPQPLTRAECEKAGEKWDETANVCDVKTQWWR